MPSSANKSPSGSMLGGWRACVARSMTCFREPTSALEWRMSHEPADDSQTDSLPSPAREHPGGNEVSGAVGVLALDVEGPQRKASRQVGQATAQLANGRSCFIDQRGDVEHLRRSLRRLPRPKEQLRRHRLRLL